MVKAFTSAALVIALLGSTEKLSLVCDGTVQSIGVDEKPASMAVIIDLDAGTMETNLGVLTLAKTTDMELKFEKPSDTFFVFRSVIDATFNRISGHLQIWDFRSHLGRRTYDLTCTKTTPV